MKRKQYREEKIIAILKEHEAGASVPDLSRSHGFRVTALPSAFDPSRKLASLGSQVARRSHDYQKAEDLTVGPQSDSGARGTALAMYVVTIPALSTYALELNRLDLAEIG